MHPKYRVLESELTAKLQTFSQNVMALPGIEPAGATETLAKQFVESRRKIDRMERLANKSFAVEITLPGSTFDPERAAVFHKKAGNLEESWWLSFLSVHFGRHANDNWLLCSNIYGAFSGEPFWTWQRVSGNPVDFSKWLAQLDEESRAKAGRFGNHRKYESLTAGGSKGTGGTVISYVKWIKEFGGPEGLIKEAIRQSNGEPQRSFKFLYKSMKSVSRFGRLGKFDFLTLLGKLDLAPIAPDSTYMAQATGPKSGATLLFCGNKGGKVSNSELEDWVSDLDQYLKIGMQAMEDGLCNWQKSPSKFIPFRG
jgi:Alpha-glutamyl/putrescinyl thymine pyrophosphorylase clade 3